MIPYFVDPTRKPVFPPGLEPDRHGLVAFGGCLSPEILLEAYAKGIFPWTGKPPIPWFSPDPRMVLIPSEVKTSRSMRQLLNRGHFEVRADTHFEQVMSIFLLPLLRISHFSQHSYYC